MNILVTGGAGFIGSHTVDGLIKRGNRVVIVDNLSTGRREFVHPEAEFLRMDIADAGLGKLFTERRFDAVIHCAAQIDVRKSVEDPLADAGTNILGSLNLCEAAARAEVRRLVFSSTGGAIYGDTDLRPTPEDAECRPISPYGITKLSVEHYLHYYRVVQGLDPFVLRYGNVYGPRQNPHGEAGVVAIFCRRMLDGLPLVINGDGKQTRDYVFVEDVARANLLALNCPVGDTVNIGTAVETDVNRIFHLLNEALEAGLDEPHGPPKAGEQQTSCLDVGKAHRVLGWEPAVDFEEGIARTAEWFRAHHGS